MEAVLETCCGSPAYAAPELGNYKLTLYIKDCIF